MDFSFKKKKGRVRVGVGGGGGLIVMVQDELAWRCKGSGGIRDGDCRREKNGRRSLLWLFFFSGVGGGRHRRGDSLSGLRK